MRASSFPFYALAALLVGLLAGSAGFRVPGRALDVTLALLILLAGFLAGRGLPETVGSSRSVLLLGVTLAFSTMLSGALAGALVSGYLEVDPRIGAVIGMSSGWYSLAGPLVATVNPAYGVTAFLANIAREAAHIILYPTLSSCCPLEAIAIGGATTMDSGLPVVAVYGDRKTSVIAVVHGTTITLALPALIPLLIPA